MKPETLDLLLEALGDVAKYSKLPVEPVSGWDGSAWAVTWAGPSQIDPEVRVQMSLMVRPDARDPAAECSLSGKAWHRLRSAVWARTYFTELVELEALRTSLRDQPEAFARRVAEAWDDIQAHAGELDAISSDREESLTRLRRLAESNRARLSGES